MRQDETTNGNPEHQIIFDALMRYGATVPGHDVSNTFEGRIELLDLLATRIADALVEFKKQTS